MGQSQRSQTSTLWRAVSVSSQTHASLNKGQTTANSEFRELKYPTWEDTISRVKHNVLSHGSLSLWFLRGWSQKYSKFKSDPITGFFFCFFVFFLQGKHFLLVHRDTNNSKTTAVKLTLHKWRPSYPDAQMETLTWNYMEDYRPTYFNLSKISNNPEAHTEWRAHTNISMTS